MKMGKVIAGVMDDEKKNILNSYELMKNGVNKGGFSIDNTTIGIVATNAKLDKAECKKVSQMAHNGYAKAIFPIHTPHDGDTIFTIATGEVRNRYYTFRIFSYRGCRKKYNKCYKKCGFYRRNTFI